MYGRLGKRAWCGGPDGIHERKGFGCNLFAGEGVGSPRRGQGGRRNPGARIGDGKLCTGKQRARGRMESREIFDMALRTPLSFHISEPTVHENIYIPMAVEVHLSRNQ